MTTYFNEMYEKGRVRPHYRQLEDWTKAMPAELREMKQAEAEALFRRIGITFAVYGEGGDPDRLIPFDMFPRVFTAREWSRLERGIKQRARALNAFLCDVYGRGEIVRAGRIPARLVYRNAAYEKSVVGFTPPKGVYSHVVGIDLVRTGADEFFVLEDNCRTPSGVSYMLENREIMMRMFPELFRENRIEPVDSYPEKLRRTLASVAPAKCSSDPTVVLLTPGHFNSAYYEHSFLADLMGVELVEGADLFVEGEFLYMRTTEGPKRVDVLYRRIDDAFIDPLCFRPDSMLGVPGLMDVYRSGGVTICSAPGAGVADDKAVYTFVPEMVRFYLGEEPLLNNVPTWQCGKGGGSETCAVEPLRSGGEGGAWLGRLRDAGRAEILEGPDRGLPRPDRGRSRQLHRPAHARALHHAHLRERGHRPAPRRPAPLLPRRRAHRTRPGRPHPRGAHRGLARGELVAGRGRQGHLGSGGVIATC